MKISLVIPVYNLKKFLPRCMDSLFTQTLQSYEIILVNDGSNDGSAELCDQYVAEHPGLVRCIHKSNGGLSSARNAGMDVAQGDYVIFPDPDDWVEPDYVEQLLSIQEKYQPDLVCLGHFIDYDDRRLPANEGQNFTQMTGADAQKALLMPPCMSGFAWNKLYQLDIIKAHRLKFLDDVGTTEDLDFAFRYLQFCDSVCFAPEIRVYHYYQRSGAATHSGFSVKKLQSIHTYEKMIDIAGQTSEIGRAAKEEICNTAINLLPIYLNSGIEDEVSYLKIKEYIQKYYFDYQKSSRYSKGRKIQAVLARYVPRLYCTIKNIVSHE